MGAAPAFASVSEAIEMARAALGYLAAADAAQLDARPRPRACGGWSRPTRSPPRRGRRSCPRSPPARGTPRTRTTARGPG